MKVEDWDSSPSSTLQDHPSHSSNHPLLPSLQASALSDPKTRQRQNTRVHKDTRSRLQRTHTLKIVTMQTMERVRAELVPLRRGFLGLMVSKYDEQKTQMYPPPPPPSISWGSPHTENLSDKGMDVR